MFIGHYGIALGIKRARSTISLGALFFAVTFCDVVLYGLSVIGVESSRYLPGFTRNFSYQVDGPWSHSLLGSILFGIGALGLTAAVTRSLITGFWVGLAIFSHFPADWLVHGPNMAIVPWSAKRVGLGLWNYPFVSHPLELAIYFFGLWGYLRMTLALDKTGSQGILWLSGVLVLFNTLIPFSPAPPDMRTCGIVTMFATLMFVAAAEVIDRHRRVRCI